MSTRPRQPALDREVAMRLAATEYTRFADQLHALAPDDWTRSTACPDWDVHAMACHVVGMADMSASVVEQVRQMTKARRTKGDDIFVNALTALQVAKHVHRPPAEVAARMTAIAPEAARGRRRTPAFMRNRSLGEQEFDFRDVSKTEPWSLGYLVDVILTRDTWMHRSDIAVAAGRSMLLTPDHDGVLVDDVVREWAGRHGQPCRLTLTGPAGGTWTFGTDGRPLELDAVEFCRVLSGRGEPADPLLAQAVPF